MQFAAEKLELACENEENQSLIKEHFEQLMTHLQPVLTSLEQLSTIASPEAHNKLTIARGDLNNHLEQLAELLENFDTQAQDLINQLQTFHLDKLISKQLELIAESVTDYDFEQAQELLKAIMTG